MLIKFDYKGSKGKESTRVVWVLDSAGDKYRSIDLSYESNQTLRDMISSLKDKEEIQEIITGSCSAYRTFKKDSCSNVETDEKIILESQN